MIDQRFGSLRGVKGKKKREEKIRVVNTFQRQLPRSAYTLLFPALLFPALLFPALLLGWLITLTLTLTLIHTIFDNIILEKIAGSKSGVYVDLYNGIFCSNVLKKRCAIQCGKKHPI